MLLHQTTWPRVEAYLQRSTGIILPIGSTEQHGPMGMIGTDAICAETVAMAVGERVDALVGPTFAIGMAQHHLGFPGSITLRPSTLIAVLRDAILSLARGGFRAFYLINGHGGNIATVQAAFAEIYATYSLDAGYETSPGIRCRLTNWFTLPGVTALARELYADAEGSHATPSEISLTWHRFPEAAERQPLEPPIAPSGSFTDALDYRERFPDGRIGANSSLASKEAGARFLEVAAREAAADYLAFLG